METTVNLKDILDEKIDLKVFATRFPATTTLILEVMKEACRQTLELAAENANMLKAFDYGTFNENIALFDKEPCKLFYKNTHGHGDCGYEAVKINKASILNTINQII